MTIKNTFAYAKKTGKGALRVRASAINGSKHIRDYKAFANSRTKSANVRINTVNGNIVVR